MAKRPYHMKAPRTPDFDAFITRPWISDRRDLSDALYPNLMALWSDKLRSYHAYADIAKTYQAQHLQFEYLVTRPIEAVVALLKNLGVSSPKVDAVPVSTKGDTRSADDIANYYAREEWRQHYTRDRIASMNAKIDWDVATIFGYQPLDPADFPDQPAEKPERALRRAMILGPNSKFSNRKTGTAAAA